MCICSKEFKIFTLYIQRKSYYVEKPQGSGDGDGLGVLLLIYRHIQTFLYFQILVHVYERVVTFSLQYINGWRYIDRSIIFLQDPASLLLRQITRESLCFNLTKNLMQNRYTISSVSHNWPRFYFSPLITMSGMSEWLLLTSIQQFFSSIMGRTS